MSSLILANLSTAVNLAVEGKNTPPVQCTTAQAIQAPKSAIAKPESAIVIQGFTSCAIASDRAARESAIAPQLEDETNRGNGRREWVEESCVSPEIFEANVFYLDGDDAVELATHDLIANLGGWAAQYATGKVISIRKRYEHLKAGAWFVSGLDPLNNWERTGWGQCKPFNPRRSWKDPDKNIKYETPPGTPPQAIYLAGAADWAAVQTDVTAPVLWNEGAKKAGTALTIGYNAVALVGVNSGYRVKDSLGNPVKAHLAPDVEAMAQPGRVHYLAFDQDEAPKTRQKVAIALSRFGGLLKANGCEVRIVRWPSAKGKGIDDLIANHGPDVFHQAVKDALAFDEWQMWQALENCLTTAPSIRLKVNNLTALSPESVPDEGVIAIASAKGSGKTNLIGGLIVGSDKALLAGHRISLMRNLSERCAVHYRGDLDKQGGRFIDGEAYTLRVGTCVDSLLAINPANFAGCDLVLDEVCQVLRHLLTSSTCNKNGMRSVLLMRFRELVQAARRVIIADADLSDRAIAYIQQLRSDDAKPFLIRNDYQAPGYPVRFIESPDASAITGEMLRDLQDGKRLYIATDSKGGRLARMIGELKQKVPHLLINSDTSGGETEQAFMTNPDRHLTAVSLQAVIASPSAGTGLSIECDCLDKVYGIFYGGSITDADMAQALIRVRANVPRVVWCAKYGNSFSKVGRETAPVKLLNLLRQKTDANTLLIRASLSELTSAALSSYDWTNDPHVNYWAEIEAQRNRAMWNLRTALKVRLMHEGHQLEVVELGKDDAAKILLREAREALKTEQAIAIEGAENLTTAEAKALDQLDGLDTAQRLALKKWQIAEFYCLSVDKVDAGLVLWDNSGRRRSQVLNLEGFIDPDAAIDADVRSLEKQAQWRKGLIPWDASTAALKQEFRRRLGLEKYLAPGKTWDSESLAEFKQQALALAPQIKAALNFTVQESMSATQILNQLLGQMGVECDGKQHRVNGTRVRTYSLDPVTQKLNTAILERRKARRIRLSEDVTRPHSINKEIVGCDKREQKVKAPEIGKLGGAAQVAAVSTAAMLAPSLPLLDALADDHYDLSAWEESA